MYVHKNAKKKNEYPSVHENVKNMNTFLLQMSRKEISQAFITSRQLKQEGAFYIMRSFP